MPRVFACSHCWRSPVGNILRTRRGDKYCCHVVGDYFLYCPECGNTFAHDSDDMSSCCWHCGYDSPYIELSPIDPDRI